MFPPDIHPVVMPGGRTEGEEEEELYDSIYKAKSSSGPHLPSVLTPRGILHLALPSSFFAHTPLRSLSLFWLLFNPQCVTVSQSGRRNLSLNLRIRSCHLSTGTHLRPEPEPSKEPDVGFDHAVRSRLRWGARRRLTTAERTFSRRAAALLDLPAVWHRVVIKLHISEWLHSISIYDILTRSSRVS